MVASTRAYSMSGSSETASNNRCQTPAFTQSRKRVKMLFQWPNAGGRSRQGLPVRTTHKTASTNRRLFLPLRPGSPGLPRQRGCIFAHWASVKMKRSIRSLNHSQAWMKIPESQQALADDPTFGPVVAFGSGGTAVEVINDKALALPPLDLQLASDLMARTRVSRILKAYRDVPAADERAVALVLVKIAQLAADVPEVRELDLNPLLADTEGVIAVDARVAGAPLPAEIRTGAGHPRFAVRPYPKEWERELTLRNGQPVFVRPIRPEDQTLYRAFLARVSKKDLRLRFFSSMRVFTDAFVARLTQIDYARAVAFVALDRQTGELMGEARLHADANHESGEYGILIRSDLKGQGLGWELMRLLIDWARTEGLRVIEGQVLCENEIMLAMCRELGFTVSPDPTDPDISVVTYALSAAVA